MTNDVVLVAVGCLTGVLAGMLGAGGGFAAVTLLLAAGANVHVAVGTSLVYLMVMGGWGTFMHLHLRTVDRRLVVAIGVGAAISALVGAQMAESLRSRDLTLALGLFTACVTGVSLAWPQTRRPLVLPGSAAGRRKDALSTAGPAPSSAAAGRVETKTVAAAPTDDAAVRPETELTGRALGGAVTGGSVIGLLKGLFGVGAGFLIVPMMVGVGRVPKKMAVGSSLFAILVASVVAALRHYTLGNVDGGDLLALVPGGLFGSFVGSRAARSMSPAAIRRVFLAMMATSSVYLLVLASAYP